MIHSRLVWYQWVSVQNNVIGAGFSKVERLDIEPRDVEADGFPVDLESWIKAAEDFFVAGRPAEVGPQRQSYPARAHAHKVAGTTPGIQPNPGSD